MTGMGVDPFFHEQHPWIGKLVRAIPSGTEGELCTGPVVIAEVDPERYAELNAGMADRAHRTTVYAKAAMLLSEDAHGTVHAITPDENLAYVSEPTTGRLTITGCDADAAAEFLAKIIAPA
ncbi:hypothetical protein [Streptomyces sp. NPDC090021]|uniref:hypothetical protein n=1 Tax=Streptomyces sp. NPDC090021 TaxID=3365919 RepID=UPI0038115A88